ncbi:MAG: ABC-type multidrug transport system fused ATPase/permease subunit, partial [bacterium]
GKIIGVTPRFRIALASLVVFFALKTIASLFAYRLQLKLVYAISSSLSDRVFNQSFNVNLNTHKKILTSDRLMEVNTVTNSLPYLVLLPAISALTEMAFVCVSFSVLLVIKPVLVLALVIALLPQSLVLFYISRKKLKDSGQIINERLAEQNELVSQSVLGYSEINLYNLGNQYRRQLSDVRETVYSNRLKVQMFSTAAPQRLMELLTVLALCIMAIYFYGFNQTAGFYSTLALFAAAAFRLLPSLNRVVMGANTLSSFVAILDLIPKAGRNEVSDELKHEIDTFNSLEIKSLNFGFESEGVLFKDLSLSVNKGDFIGIYGPSGAGKTTLVNLILGFYELPKQHIQINKLPIARVKRSWQNKLGYIKQDAFVTSLSIEQNIAFGSDVVDEEKVIELLKQVKLWDWVLELPKGVETSIGDQGNLISGGQKQRLAIARALYRDAEVLICDEITTALDDENRKGIINLIEELNNIGTTIIMISHDLSAFEKATKRYGLKDGKLFAK